MTAETVQERVRRAKSQSMEVTLVDTDPVVAQVYNEDSDRIHTVIPDSVHCSCEDHTYRNTVCKHLLRLMLAESHLGEITREALKEERNQIGAELTELQEQMEELRSRRDQIVSALDAVGASQIADSSVEDIVAGFEAEAEAREEADDEAPFEKMVADLTGDQQ